MPHEEEDIDPLLELIPSSLRRTEQVSRWFKRKDAPTYIFRRKPASLDELHRYLCNGRMAIWRDNGTLTYVTSSSLFDYPESRQKYLSLMYYGTGPCFSIIGETDSALVETATFFLSLKATITENSSLSVDVSTTYNIDFRAARCQCLMHIFEEAPSRKVTFGGLTLSAEQSSILATRTHPVQLSLLNCVFEDEGSAFLDALE
jgi:hypothetical protein